MFRVFLSSVLLVGCGVFGTQPEPASPPPQGSMCSNGGSIGSTRWAQCPRGQSGRVLEVCTERGWIFGSSTCQAPQQDSCEQDTSLVTFEKDIRGIITRSCVNCHSTPERYDEYETAKQLVDGMIYRINLPAASLDRMPRSPAPQLSAEERDLFQLWKEGGLLEKVDCSDGADPSGDNFATLSLDYLETQILNDLNRLDSQSQKEVGYVHLLQKFNLRSSDATMVRYEEGINKTVNSLSTENRLYRVTPIDARNTIFRVDLNAFGFLEDGKFDPYDDWDSVILEDKFQFESFTNKGIQIKQLTNRRVPWLHADNYVFSANQDETYYDILDIADTLDQLFIDENIDFQREFDDFNVIQAGFFGSPITQNKNRIIARVDNDENYFWITFDPDGNFEPEKNFFEFPLLPQANGVATALFDASEVIYTLPNGMQAYGLYNAAGVRENEAPIDVVTDTQSPFDPVIVNAISCYRCHGRGLLVAEDQIRESVLSNASEFDAEDVEKVRAYYAPNRSLNATFVSDNLFYQKALKEIGVDVNKVDPVNFLTDSFRKDYTLADVAAFVFFSEEDFKRCINSSSGLKAEIGQLLSGGTVSLAQFQTSFPNIVVDCRLGQDPIDG